MKIKMGATFSFSKLLKYVNSPEFGDFLSNVSVNPIIKASKEKIRSGDIRPVLKKSTIERRRYKKSVSSFSPLYDTGNLYKSLQLSDVRTESGVLKGTKGIMMESYGLKHLTGFFNRGGGRVPKRNFISFKGSEKAANPIVAKFKEKFRRTLAK